jgi:hypothetical protein
MYVRGLHSMLGMGTGETLRGCIVRGKYVSSVH